MKSGLAEIRDFWSEYLAIYDWNTLIEGIEPHQSGCGKLYEIAVAIGRPDESLAIADMRELEYTLPHYHKNGETEIYFIIEGNGLVNVGSKEIKVSSGDIITTPPDTAHYISDIKKLVLAVVNTPPFNPHNSFDLYETNKAVGFDYDRFLILTGQKSDTKIR